MVLPSMTLDAAVDVARTGDVWVFRGRSPADRAIQTVTNSPVNHVGMAVVLEDLPPLMWHAELGKSLPDMWSGGHHRGVQLHVLRDAVHRWQTVYGQRGYFRQLTPEITREHEDALLRVIARLDGASFPSTTGLALRWAKGRSAPWRRRAGRLIRREEPAPSPENGLSAPAVYCAEVVAETFEAMGVLDPGMPSNWYDPGRFWSGDRLPLAPGWALGEEIPVG